MPIDRAMPDHGPDENGTFSRHGVERLVHARACMLLDVQEHFCAIAVAGRVHQPEYAIAQDGRWSAVAVFRACSRLHRRRIPRHEPARGTKLDRLNNLREELIAEVIAADGTAPYRPEGRSVALDALLFSAETRKLGYGDRSQVQRAVRTVVDAGLAVLTLGPRGGLASAEIEWTPLARRHAVTRLADDVEAAVRALADVG